MGKNVFGVMETVERLAALVEIGAPLRLTVETGIPKAWAARLKLSNCATFTKIAISFRSVILQLLHKWKIDSIYFHLIA